MTRRREVDIIDAHVTSTSNVVDVFSQYPLLDGDKRYTVEITEFTCPLAGQGPLPETERVGAEFILEVRRKVVGTHLFTNANSLTTLPAPLGDPDRYAPNHVYQPGSFTDDAVIFKKDLRRPMATPGDLAYHLQRFFNDIRSKYVAAGGNLDADDHGGGDDVPITDQTPFCTVQIEPNGHLKLFFSPVFTKHFYIGLSRWGQTLIGMGDAHQVIAFRTAAGAVIQGRLALTDNPNGGVIIAGQTAETIEYPATYTLERHFDHRVRLEIESQMSTPPTIAWVTKEAQKMTNIIATFPISTTTQTSVLCNSEGTPSGEIGYQTDMLVGDITWRKAENKISERYLLNNSQFFHNIRLEVFLVRKEWVEADASFMFAKEKLVFVDGESWTCKLRFRSV